MLFRSLASLCIGALAVSANNWNNVGLNDGTISKVRSKMLAIIGHSWEYGTATEALLELEESDLSVYGEKPFPPSRTLSANSPVISLAEYVMSIRPPGILALMEDGAAGDPASMGVAVLLANQTLHNSTYAEAAAQQLDFLLNYVPRAPNGAISHRVSEAQLWNDFVYMGPPFIAYYGALTSNITLLREAKNQIGHYREVLRDTNNTGLWHHILLGSWNEPSHWGTGNAWAAAGTTRVLQTLLKSHHAPQLVGDMWELAGWAKEIICAAWVYQKPNGTLFNHPDEDDWPESAWTTLLASATYRLAVMTGDETYIPNAARAFKYIGTQIANDGTLQNVVDPFEWRQQGTQSPEGQAFVLLLQSAWRDYVKWKQSGCKPTLYDIKWW
ncbi:Six-hairpin glycosidase [Serendipita vermifera]|nr:Six-hairpin glycosidase [Serendipita vermifera]